MEPRRRSNFVTLSLIGLPLGAVALANAFPGQLMRRNLYADRATCERDYSPQQCQQGSNAGTAYRGYWHGPYYYSDRGAPGARSDPGIGRTGYFVPTETSVRGGFGRFGRAMHVAG